MFHRQKDEEIPQKKETPLDPELTLARFSTLVQQIKKSPHKLPISPDQLNKYKELRKEFGELKETTELLLEPEDLFHHPDASEKFSAGTTLITSKAVLKANNLPTDEAQAPLPSIVEGAVTGRRIPSSEVAARNTPNPSATVEQTEKRSTPTENVRPQMTAIAAKEQLQKIFSTTPKPKYQGASLSTIENPMLHAHFTVLDDGEKLIAPHQEFFNTLADLGLNPSLFNWGARPCSTEKFGECRKIKLSMRFDVRSAFKINDPNATRCNKLVVNLLNQLGNRASVPASHFLSVSNNFVKHSLLAKGAIKMCLSKKYIESLFTLLKDTATLQRVQLTVRTSRATAAYAKWKIKSDSELPEELSHLNTKDLSNFVGNAFSAIHQYYLSTDKDYADQSSDKNREFVARYAEDQSTNISNPALMNLLHRRKVLNYGTERRNIIFPNRRKYAQRTV